MVSRPHSRRRSWARALQATQALLLLSGGSLLALYALAQVDAARGRDQALEAFEAARHNRAIVVAQQSAATPSAAAVASAQPATLAYNEAPDQSLWGTTRIAAYRDSLTADITPLGVLKIPDVDLTVPIFEGTSDLTLNRGVGWIEGTAAVDQRGNLGLAGHRDGFFRVLKDVEIGDTIEVQSLDGVTRYRITEFLIVAPEDVYVLAPTDAATLTLVTCYPFYFIGEAPQRYIVKGVAEI
jgi:sortase A